MNSIHFVNKEDCISIKICSSSFFFRSKQIIMKLENTQVECSFCKWYPLFSKNALEGVILPVPEEVCKYLEHDAFLLPLEATTNGVTCNSEWSDGSAVNDESEEVNPIIYLISNLALNIFNSSLWCKIFSISTMPSSLKIN